MNAKQLMYYNIPVELRTHYCNWRNEDHGGFKPTKVPYKSGTLRHASVTNPETFSDFETAVNVSDNYDGIGKILTRECGLFVIDLDNAWEKLPSGVYKYADPQAVEAVQIKVFENFRGYWERSPSKLGTHGWGYSRVALPGRRRDGIEVYTTDRFMTMTGDVICNDPLMDHTDLLQQLHSQMGGESKTSTTTDLTGLTKPQLHSDYEILQMASSASNGQKFIDLYEGRWQDMYPSQSEADQALVNMLVFYSQNVEQVIRIFRASALGKRPKAHRNDYLMKPTYGLINKAFDKMMPTLDLDTLRNNLEQQLAAKRSAAVTPEPPIQPQAPIVGNLAAFRAYLPLSPSENALCRANLEAVFSGDVAELPSEPLSCPSIDSSIHISECPEQVATPAPTTSTPKAMKKSAYSVPPGIVGEIAKFIHDAAPRPVPEIAIAGAIGLMAGVCGRAYNVSGTGLNQYTFLLAMTGAGKEGLSGIDKLMNAVYRTAPGAADFIGPAEIASPQALVKYISKTSKSFVSLVGEFSLKLKQICSHSASSNESGLKRAFLDLYAKSGHGKTLGKMIYSDKDKNTDVVTGPSFSILGEGTPEKFYELLNKEMIEEGLLPRFLIMEYKGKRPKLNVNHVNTVPSPHLVDYFASICAYALQLNNGNNVLDVICDNEAQLMFDKYNDKCDNYINSGNEVSRQLWNRAHLKALKLAALLAVGVNYVNPIINAECAQWAIDIVTGDIKNILGRFETGEVGAANVQNEQVVEVKKVMRSYVEKDWSELAGYPGTQLAAWNIKAIPHSYIGAVCRTKTCFKSDKLGPIQAVKTVIGSLIESGEIVELSPMDKRQKGLVSTAKLYMIVNLNGF